MYLFDYYNFILFLTEHPSYWVVGNRQSTVALWHQASDNSPRRFLFKSSIVLALLSF